MNTTSSKQREITSTYCCIFTQSMHIMVNTYKFHKKTQGNSWVSSLGFDKEREREREMGSEVGEEREKKEKNNF